MKFFVYEHVVGGGFAGKKIPSSIVCDGYGMLEALILDSKALGHHVTTTLDLRLKSLCTQLKANKTFYISSPKDRERLMDKLTSMVDLTIIIAPETNGSLSETVNKVEENGCLTLNCPHKTLERFSSKSSIYDVLESVNVPIPRTLKIPLDTSLREVKTIVESLEYPVVFKPEDGAGCGGLSVVKNRYQIGYALEKIRQESSASHFLVQEYVKGIPASLSLTCNPNGGIPLTLNRQWVVLAHPALNSRYLGGFVPFNHPLKKKAFQEARKALKALLPLRGYVGMDVLLTKEKVYVVDVNLRFTTSYVGLRRVFGGNLLKVLLDTAFNQKLPEKITTKGYAFFGKIEASKTTEGFEPTFPFIRTSPNQNPYMLMVVWGPTLKNAERRFHNIAGRFLKKKKLQLDNIYSGGVYPPPRVGGA